VVVQQNFSYLHFLNEKWLDNRKWKQWSESYVKDLSNFLDTITKQYENKAQKRSKEISVELDKLAPDLKTTETLSQKTLQVLTSVPGIDCVLLGMRSTRYVEDAFVAFTQPAISQAEKLLLDFHN
jgi:aryl-alcohol dehydrogenase-like predicted oxidoreductase